MTYNNINYSRKGFTIVELLVVVAVIGILAAITIVSYATVTNNARDQKVKTDAQGIAVYLNKYKADHGKYPTSLDQLEGAPKAESDFQYSYDATNGTYCVTASVKGASAHVKSGNGTALEGGCDGHGVNGDPAVTNLAYNPSAETSCSGVSGYYSAPLTACPTTTSAVSGSKIFATTTNSTTSSQGLIHTVTTDAKPNQDYTCSMSFKGTPGKTIVFGGRPATATNGYISEGNGGQSVVLSSSWQRVMIDFTTPANTGILRIQYRLSSPASGVLIQADALMCTEGSTDYAYADGDTAGWAWKGTPHDSESTGPGAQ